MLGWLWRTIVGRFGCDHKWDLYKESNVVDDDGDRIGRRFYLRCERCGDFKRRAWS